MKIREFSFFIIVGIIFIAVAFQAGRKVGLFDEDDSVAEEFIEKYIEKGTGIEIDLTPESCEH